MSKPLNSETKYFVNQVKSTYVLLLDVETKITSLQAVEALADCKEPLHPHPKFTPKILNAHQAMRVIKSDDKLFVQGMASTPAPLIEALCQHVLEYGLQNIRIYHGALVGNIPWLTERFKGRIRSNTMFLTEPLREAAATGDLDIIPIMFSEMPSLFHRNIVQLDVALIHISPPDAKGFCSLGVTVGSARSAIINAKTIIAMVNRNMPRTFGDGIIHRSHIDIMVEQDVPLPKIYPAPLTDTHKRIGRIVADQLVDDGATIQIGFGKVPNAVLASLTGKKNLGIQSETFYERMLDLIEKGVVTNAEKVIHPGRVFVSAVYGSRRVYDFVNDNPMFVLGDIDSVSPAAKVKLNPKVAAINTAIEVDITGQIVLDSIGTRMVAGVGAQMNFLRGATLCAGHRGKPIIAIQSTTGTGESKIVPFIKHGAGVSSTRGHVHYVATEYGVAQLFSKSMRQRAYELIRISHPKHQKTLEEAAFKRLKCMPSP